MVDTEVLFEYVFGRQINRDRSLTDLALTITHLLEQNLVTTYDADKILWALLRSVYLCEVEEGKRSKYEIVAVKSFRGWRM
jgi:hypothetical protein